MKTTLTSNYDDWWLSGRCSKDCSTNGMNAHSASSLCEINLYVLLYQVKKNLVKSRTFEVLPLWPSNSCATFSVHRYSSHPFSESKFVSVWDLVMLLRNVDSILVEVYPGLALPAPCADFVLNRLEWISQGEEGDFEFGAPYLWNFSVLARLSDCKMGDHQWSIAIEVADSVFQMRCHPLWHSVPG